MKKLLKSEVCGSREQCTIHGKSQQSQLEKKKKKQTNKHSRKRGNRANAH